MELHNADALCELNGTSFEPLSRHRANTWPVEHREHTIPREEVKNETSENATECEVTSSKDSNPSAVGKRSYFRRNAWGSMSYSDLITKAIENSPEQRLTLSQIYDWVVQNVPYFNDKGDSNSSAGWKASTDTAYFAFHFIVVNNLLLITHNTINVLFPVTLFRILYVTTCRFITASCGFKMKVLERARGG
jgi:hypothetical protein